MAFTDEQLRRFEQYLIYRARHEEEVENIEALIARLEAAEAERDALKKRLEAAEIAENNLLPESRIPAKIRAMTPPTVSSETYVTEIGVKFKSDPSLKLGEFRIETEEK